MIPRRRSRSATAPFGPALRAALACFVVAGLTGTAMRVVGAGFALPDGLSFKHLRHAHSHLMFFAWVTPVLMVFIARRLLAAGADGEGALRRVIWANLALGLLSFPPFLIWGYAVAELGPARMPLSVIVSTLAMFAWYAFAWMYFKRRRHLAAGPARSLWDLAVVGLSVGSVGAWARGGLTMAGVADPRWLDGSVHLFLTAFSIGWLVAATLGILHDRMGTRSSRLTRIGTAGLWVATPLLFIVALAGKTLPVWLVVLGGIGALGGGVGLIAHGLALWPAIGAPETGWASRLAVWIGLGVGVATLVSAVPDVALWANATGLRLLYLHAIFLGMVTLVCSELYVGGDQTNPVPLAALILLATMLPTTSLWPAALRGPWSLELVAWGSLAPTLAALWLLWRPRLSARRTSALRDSAPSALRASPLRDSTLRDSATSRTSN